LTTPQAVAKNDNMVAKKLYKDRFDYDDGMIIEVIIWELPKPVLGSQHHYKYRLFYGNKQLGRVIGYDNERPKGDHRHYEAQEEAYTFTSVEQLIADFLADVKAKRSKA
jgi:hypothetical protein